MKIILEHDEIIKAIGQAAFNQANLKPGKYHGIVEFTATDKSPRELTATVEITPKD